MPKIWGEVFSVLSNLSLPTRLIFVRAVPGTLEGGPVFLSVTSNWVTVFQGSLLLVSEPFVGTSCKETVKCTEKEDWGICWKCLLISLYYIKTTPEFQSPAQQRMSSLLGLRVKFPWSQSNLGSYTMSLSLLPLEGGNSLWHILLCYWQDCRRLFVWVDFTDNNMVFLSV